ncbi:hypothetical protein ACLOJK_026911 [Asimina triloba]
MPVHCRVIEGVLISVGWEDSQRWPLPDLAVRLPSPPSVAACSQLTSAPLPPLASTPLPSLATVHPCAVDCRMGGRWASLPQTLLPCLAIRRCQIWTTIDGIVFSVVLLAFVRRRAGKGMGRRGWRGRCHPRCCCSSPRRLPPACPSCRCRPGRNRGR